MLHPRTKMQWGADGTAVDVSAANPVPVTVAQGIADGAAFTAGTTPVLPSGFVQRATPTTHANGDVGAARMDNRQRTMAAPEHVQILAQELSIRDTNFIIIPIAAEGYRAIGIYIDHQTVGHDQPITINLRLGDGSRWAVGATLPAGNNKKIGFFENVTGIPSDANGTAIAVPILGNWPGSYALSLSIVATTAPTVGSMFVRIHGRTI